jgi:Serine phosphatase RsbU, regulator of sigma subunit
MADRAANDLERDKVRRLLEQALSRTVERLDAYGGGIALIDPDGEVLTTHLSVGLPPEYAMSQHRRRLTATTPDPLVEAVRARRLVWVESSEELMRRYPRPTRIPPHQALAVAPIMSGSAVWGVLLLFWPDSRPADLDSGARHAIEHASQHIARLLQDAAKAGYRFAPPERPHALPLPRRTVVDCDEAQVAVEYVARLPEGCCALALDGRILFLDATAAELLGGPGRDLIGAKPWEAVPWLRDLRYEQSHRLAVLRQQPVSFTAVRPPDRHLLFQLYPDATGVSVRISHIPAERRPPEPPDAPHDGGVMGIDTLHHMIELAGALARAADVPEVVDLASDHFMLAFGAQGCALLTTESGRMRILTDRGFNPDIAEIFDRMPLTADVPGVLALTTGVPLFFADDEELARMYPALGELDSGMAAWAYLPLVVSGRTVGTCVLGYDRPHRFTEEERLALTSFSALVGQALDRARLYESKSRLVHSLQVGLLPPTLPAVPGVELAARYRPATHGLDIGGDFYDVIRVEANEIVAFVGDVQGHDADAAALMGHLRTAVHAYALTEAQPGEVLARANRLITDLNPNLLASCLFIRLDLARMQAYLATAGHYPPLLRRPGRPAEVLELPAGPVLGAAPWGGYPTVETTLSRGTILALYTDGLIEIPATDTDENLRLAAELIERSDDPLDAVAEELVRRCRPYGGHTDDTTVLLLRIVADGVIGEVVEI